MQASKTNEGGGCGHREISPSKTGPGRFRQIEELSKGGSPRVDVIQGPTVPRYPSVERRKKNLKLFEAADL